MNWLWRAICRHMTYPLWDRRDGGGRLSELASLRKSQFLPKEELERLQLARLANIVQYAHDHSEFYRRLWRRKPEISNLEDLTTLPLTEKSAIAQSLGEMVSTGIPRTDLVSAKTGGSTGTSLKVYFDVACQQMRNAAAMRTDSWAGWRPGSQVAALWGTPPVPKTFREHVRNIFHDRVFYLDTMRMDTESMSEFAQLVIKRRPEVIFGHAHSIYIFAGFLRDSGIRITGLRGIVSTSMMLLDSERAVIEEVFGVRVTNRYGCEEVGLIASECEVHRGMHVNCEHVVVELIDEEGRPARPGTEARVVVTDLINHGMPLIRYVVGDMAIGSSRTCECGRGLPLIEGLVGRTADYLKRRDGSLVAGISLVEKTLTAVRGVAQLQIIQQALDHFFLNVVPGPDYSRESETLLGEAIENAFGTGLRIEVRLVERLAQERNSKYRFSISKV